MGCGASVKKSEPASQEPKKDGESQPAASAAPAEKKDEVKTEESKKDEGAPSAAANADEPKPAAPAAPAEKAEGVKAEESKNDDGAPAANGYQVPAAPLASAAETPAADPPQPAEEAAPPVKAEEVATVENPAKPVEDPAAADKAGAAEKAAEAAFVEEAATEEAAAAGAATAKVESPKIDWNELRAKLPYEKERRQDREELFTKMKALTGDGNISLAEADLCIRDVLKMDEVFDAKPTIAAAFKAAKNYGSQSGNASEYVQWREFRIFLKFLHDYFEMHSLFSTIDSSDDRRLDITEFKFALPTLAKWGVDQLASTDQAFAGIDTSGTGTISFSEFCNWCISNNLNLEPPEED